MTNDTINNVPRELLERVLGCIDAMGWDQLEADIRAILSAPSPAGVDGLEVVGVLCISRFRNNPAMENVEFQITADVEQGQHYLCRISDAHAIIDGLRGENERIRLNIAEYNESIACYQSERDQQAQRIGELEGLLRTESARVDFLDAYIVTADAPDTGKVAMLADSGTLRECIDAALSAGKEGE